MIKKLEYVLKKIIKVFFKEGFYGIYSICLDQLILFRKKKNIKIIIKNSQNLIINGIYKSTYLTNQSNWSQSDLGTKLLGLYEEEVQKKILEIKKKYFLRNFVNFGSSDGFHILGLLKNKIFEKALAFEINPIGRKIIEHNAKINNLNNKIRIFGKADFQIVKKYLKPEELKKTLFLIDIEGAEYDLFSNDNLEVFKSSFFVIEDHPFTTTDKQKKNEFYKKINSKFFLEHISSGSRNPFKFKFLDYLNDNEKWLLISESRPEKMRWIILYPKKI